MDDPLVLLCHLSVGLPIVSDFRLMKPIYRTLTFNSNFCIPKKNRPAKPDKNSEELLTADKQVEKYKDVLEKVSKKFTQNPGISADANDPAARDKRCKKVHEHRLAQAMEESSKDLPDGVLKNVLESCGMLQDPNLS